MSERTVSENNKLWENAEKIAQQVVAEKKAASEEERRKQKKRVIKLLLLLVLIALIIVFASIAWFAMNRQTGASGMGVNVKGSNFDLTNISGSRDAIYKTYHEKVHEDGALYWNVTASSNLINYEPYNKETKTGDQGIRPGSWGMISFNVTPRTEIVDLDFNFEIIGYRLVTDDNGTPDDKTDDTEVLTKLTDLADDSGAASQNLLNGHILLFENRTVTGEGSSAVVTYSDPILSDSDMHRVFNRRFTDKDTPTQVNIYWVWPNTLSTLVDSQSFSGITTVPFTSGTSYENIVENIETYPQYYLKGAASGDRIDAQNDIAVHYDVYGDMYDQGDNEIGMRVNYLLVKLSVTERTAGGGGS